MLNYVNTVLVSNLSTGTVLDAAPATASTFNTPSADAGKFVVVAVAEQSADTSVHAANKFPYISTAAQAALYDCIKVGIVTKKNNRLVDPSTGATQFHPIVKWSNVIKAADIKSYVTRTYEQDTEDCAYIDFGSLTDIVGANNSATKGKRIIVRLTYKDMPHRYRKWTESYEYVTEDGDTKALIATNIANMINKEWKRARIHATTGNVNTTSGTEGTIPGTTTKYFHTNSSGTVVKLEALPYDDDDSVDSLSWANKVRFNANIYWTNPAAEGWEANNKHFPAGVTITKIPGKQYPASAKLVRDRESWGMGYQGILNRGEGTWPIIKPDMETKLDGTYDAITLEFENMYRAADDIQRKTKQTLEIYAEDIQYIAPIIAGFVNGADSQQSIALSNLMSRISDLEQNNNAQSAPDVSTP